MILRRPRLGFNIQHGSEGPLLISAKVSVLQRVGGGSWSREMEALARNDSFHNNDTGD
jgi:hypothetical protein